MDDLDKQLLNTLQSEFPIAPHPYRIIGELLGITEIECLERTRCLVESGVIRRIGASFDSGRLGHTSALVAAKVPKECLEEIAGIVSSFPQVTHNYGRDFEYNLWFTLICRNTEEINQVINEISTRTGISDIHVLPAERIFKIKVNFKL